MTAPSYLHEPSGTIARRVDELGVENLRLSPVGAAKFFRVEPSLDATCFAEVKRQWSPWAALSGCDSSTRAVTPGTSSFSDALHSAVARAVTGAERPVVALSGGVDSLALALVLGDVLGRPPVAATAVTSLDGYCERDATARAAELLHIDLHEVHFDADAIVAALPTAVHAAEVPLYNLHPVTKWLFAQRVSELGFDRVLTGDGADQMFTRDAGVDYLPVVGAMFEQSPVDVRWPFLDSAVVAWCHAQPPDPHKSALRNLVADRLGNGLGATPKRGRFTPPLDLRRHLDPASTQALAAELDLDASPMLDVATVDDRTLTRWVTLGLLARSHC